MIRVLLAEDQSMVLGALAALLELEPDIEVVGRARDGREALALLEEARPDVVLTDIEMPNVTGLELAAELKRRGSPARVVILTTFGRSGYLRRALDAGAAGYLLKDSQPKEIVGAIETAVRGETPLSPRIARLVVQRARMAPSGQAATVAAADLTERELDVLRLLADGRDNRQIGEALYLSPTTVKRHVSSIVAKLGVSNRVQAAIWAVRAGLL